MSRTKHKGPGKGESSQKHKLQKATDASIKKPKPNALTSGRPPTAGKPKGTISSQKTKKNINEYHQLNKKLANAEAKGETAEADALRKRIEDIGGLEAYQRASIQGQANDRGGDSSETLMGWLKPVAKAMDKRNPKLKMLEIGALSTTNACSKSGLFDIQRIDLNSQAEGITKQDFMERPTPTDDTERFDVISLSLVLNFVTEPVARGDMLKRTCHFLDQRVSRTFPGSLQAVYPALFLVLPAPCITNSRYMNEERLTCMMASFGYVLLHRKLTDKIIYFLWQLRDKPVPDMQNFPKKVVNSGGARNNFCVVLR